MEIFNVFFFAFGGITGCGSASPKLCVCDTASPWSQRPSPDSQCSAQHHCRYPNAYHNPGRMMTVVEKRVLMLLQLIKLKTVKADRYIYVINILTTPFKTLLASLCLAMCYKVRFLVKLQQTKVTLTPSWTALLCLHKPDCQLDS